MYRLAFAAALTLTCSAVHAAPSDITRWENLNWMCVYSIKLSDEQREQTCAAADKLAEKLEARGYCIYGHGVVGVSSKDKKHCYERKGK